MSRDGFEPTIPVFERAKVFHALDRAATVIGPKFHKDKEIFLLVSVYNINYPRTHNGLKDFFPWSFREP
jgi:hypothetical protein